MKRITARFFLSITLVSFLLNSFSGVTFADTYFTVQLRLERLKLSTSTGGQVCITTPTANNGTENNVQIIFPTGFAVNSTASSWTINTTDIPEDATAWPGISTATSVNGQIVTFPSADLSTDTYYCFTFSSNNTITTPSASGNYQGFVRTRATNTIIDSAEYAIAITNNDQINVTATVPAEPDDFEASLAISSSNDDTFRQDTVITYTLTYGSNLSSATQITPEIEWNLGTIATSEVPTVEVVDYVVGSATQGYGGTQPVVDIANKKVSWDIASFPGNTHGQQVSISLRTTTQFTDLINVYFYVDGRVYGPGTQTADSSVKTTYRYNYSNVTPRPPGDGKSDNRSDGIGFAEKPLRINHIEVRRVNQNSATLYITTSKPTITSVSYDYRRTHWNNTANSNSNSYEHLINLSDLNPNTKYYFRIHTQHDQEIIDSELFAFRTASESTPVEIDKESLIIVSQNIILFDSASFPNPFPRVKIPTNILYSAKFKAKNFDQIKKITAISRNDNVLGINNIVTFNPGTDANSAIEVAPGQFVTTMTSNPQVGNFRLLLRIEDFNGNITEEPIAVVGTVNPMKIVESGTKKPIENARVRFYLYNERLRVFELLSHNIIPIKNPSYSEPDGTLQVVLPDGRYKAEIESILHESKKVEFTINRNQGDGYPTIELKIVPFNIFNMISYYYTTFEDLKHTFDLQIENIKTSSRFLDFATLLALILFIFLIALSASHRYAIPIVMLPWFVLYHIATIFKKKNHEYVVQGLILDGNTRLGVENASVYISRSNGQIIARTQTNQFGEFYATTPSLNVRLTISHKNYRSFTEKFTASRTNKRLTISIIKIKKDHIFTMDGALWYLRYIFSTLFESLIFTTILLEIALIAKFGFLRVLPFIIISTISLFLWASFHRNRRISG